MPPSLPFRLTLAGLWLLALSTSVQAAAPAEFGHDWDDPRTAEPAVARPPGLRHCTVEIVHHGFAGFEPYRREFSPPADCPGPWHKVVLDMHGSVKGRQYDRMGQISIGGVTVLRTSTPEPSREGIAWQVEKDVSAYAPLFRQPQPVVMELGNLVNETYTGVFDIRATLTFYPADAAHPAAASADRIEPVRDAHRAGADLVGMFALPADAQRLVAEIYANGSGGGCEEFWYLSAPQEGYSCKSEHGPYREVQVLVDGQVAGIAMPYPHIYTGGWSNPFLWYAIPAPHAFDLPPQRFELTPFIGRLNDGKPHELRIRVVGLAENASGWSVLPNLHIWRNPQGQATRGELTAYALGELEREHPLTTQPDGGTALAASGRRRLKLSGWVSAPQGRVDTTVEYEVAMRSEHRWNADESDDRLKAEWTDLQRIRVEAPGQPASTRVQSLEFGLDGGIRTQPENGHPRLTTDLVIRANEEHRRTAGDGPARWSRVRNVFDGAASYTQEVPREQRHATGRSRQRYEWRDSEGGCRGRTLSTVNGYFTEDRNPCGD